MQLSTRKEVPVEQTWDLSLIYAEERQMWEALERAKEAVKHLSETYSGRLNTAENIVNCLDEMEPILQTISRIWCYTGLAMEVDYTDNELRERHEKASDEITRMDSDMAFVDSEILLAPDEELQAAVGIACEIHCLLLLILSLLTSKVYVS